MIISPNGSRYICTYNLLQPPPHHYSSYLSEWWEFKIVAAIAASTKFLNENYLCFVRNGMYACVCMRVFVCVCVCARVCVSGQVELHKKQLNFWVKSSVRLTNSDWHDGYMEQNEKIQEYVTRAGKFIHDGKVCVCHNAFVCAGACVSVCVCERVYVYAGVCS